MAMFNKVASIRDRRYLRVAIWAGLLGYAVYLSGAAWAGQFATKAGYVGRWAAEAVTIGDSVKTVPGLFAGKDERLAFQRPTLGDPRDEISCLALNIYHEARGEPDEGKLAVGHVVMNRVMSTRFPSTVCKVVRQGGEVRRYRCQFSWWCDGRSDMPRNKVDWQKSSEFALAVYWSQTDDPTDGALWYHADYVSPNWRKDFIQGPKIGRHIFYQQRPSRNYRVATSFTAN